MFLEGLVAKRRNQFLDPVSNGPKRFFNKVNVGRVRNIYCISSYIQPPPPPTGPTEWYRQTVLNYRLIHRHCTEFDKTRRVLIILPTFVKFSMMPMVETAALTSGIRSCLKCISSKLPLWDLHMYKGGASKRFYTFYLKSCTNVGFQQKDAMNSYKVPDKYASSQIFGREI
jgi:hypothetical protein